MSYVEFYEDASSTVTSASYYSYDVHGNVKEMVSDDPTLDNLGTRYKHMAYYYDLVSGKVNIVSYQNGSPDQLWHRYEYDADNRLTIAETSADSLRWERDAKYFYYLHGPLGRSEIGHDKVQGLDYAYTLHGWIKGINSNTIVASRDMGRDGALNGNNITSSDLDNGTINASNKNNMSPHDVFGYTIGYYNTDYTSVGTNTFDASKGSAAGPLTSTATDLYNGNISNWVMAFTDDNESRVETIGKKYAYDQLNRIRTVDCYWDMNFANDDVVTNNTFAGASSITDYEETFNYDPNGNILIAQRTGDGSTAMDDFDYYYKRSGGGTYQWSYGGTTYGDETNQLDHVDDNTGYSANYADDVDDQAAGNYTYDEIGNLVDDNQEQIEDIEWTIYGKIRRITRESTSDKPDLEFRYDAMGNRICKIVKPKDATGALLDQKQWTYTYYNRDASGNVMAVYDRDLNTSGSDIVDNITLSEQHLYGSSRVGLRKPLNNDGSEITIGGFTFTPGTVNADGTFPVNTIVSSTTASNQPSGYRWMTRKNYELSNHLGNVYAVVTDKKQGIATTQYLTSVSYYTSDVIMSADYYAFGATMPQRTYNSPDYRFGFNGKENDNETGTQDYGFRIYNPSLGKFLSVDPLTSKYPMLTPYQFASNRPICAIDLDGLEAEDVTGSDPCVQDVNNATDYQNNPYNAPTWSGSSESLPLCALPATGQTMALVKASGSYSNVDMANGAKVDYFWVPKYDDAGNPTDCGEYFTVSYHAEGSVMVSPATGHLGPDPYAVPEQRSETFYMHYAEFDDTEGYGAWYPVVKAGITMEFNGITYMTDNHQITYNVPAIAPQNAVNGILSFANEMTTHFPGPIVINPNVTVSPGPIVDPIIDVGEYSPTAFTYSATWTYTVQPYIWIEDTPAVYQPIWVMNQ